MCGSFFSNVEFLRSTKHFHLSEAEKAKKNTSCAVLVIFDILCRKNCHFVAGFFAHHLSTSTDVFVIPRMGMKRFGHWLSECQCPFGHSRDVKVRSP